MISLAGRGGEDEVMVKVLRRGDEVRRSGLFGKQEFREVLERLG
jgi:hypothetical protein